MSVAAKPGPPETKKWQSRLGAVLFLVGLVLAVVLSIVVFWPDQEATAFDRGLIREEALRSLHCPLVITPKDEATIGVTIVNTHVRPTTLRIRSHIAEGSLAFLREDIQQIALEPGEKQTLTWPIFMEDAAYDFMIIARVNQFQRVPFPARAASCGVLALNMGWITGNQLVALLVVAAGLCLVVGSALWLRSDWPLTWRRREAAQRAGAMLVLVLASVIAGLLKLPIIALILLFLSVVFVISLIERLT
ncbi:MAG: hypothetical protein JSW55_06300 [Chloroflexota bacterium]|nr:MAG: hypothetical protein JSW55_06300 [Chloroflexota bacterium]